VIGHFLDLDNFDLNELRNFLILAKRIKKNPNKYSSVLKNKTLGLLFEKQSTRTRLSFAVGMTKLGGNVIEINNDQIGFNTRESAGDILKVMSQYIDVLMIRNNDHKQIISLSLLNFIPLINGLSNYSHPCQILSDIFTIEEKLGNIENKTIAWLGDVNNVLISLIHAAEIFKFKLNILTPKLFIDKHSDFLSFKKLRFTKFTKDIDNGLENADCVMTDTWVSMGEKNFKNKKLLLKKFQVNDEIMKKAKKNAIFMHCLPAHRNEEVTDSVIDSSQSIVWEQAKNRMYVQQSILCHVLNNVKS